MDSADSLANNILSFHQIKRNPTVAQWDYIGLFVDVTFDFQDDAIKLLMIHFLQHY